MSDQDQRKQMILEFRRTVAQHPNCAFHWTVVPEGRQCSISRGFAGTSDLAMTFAAIVRDVEQLHVYGNCPHCDRLAMAILAAHEAFNRVFGAERTECAN